MIVMSAMFTGHLLMGYSLAQDQSQKSQQSQQTIAAVRFAGLNRTSKEYVRGVAAVRIGDPVNQGALDIAVARLIRTGRFLTVDYEIIHADDGIRVLFKFQERTIVTAITFEGNSHFARSKLAQQVSQKVNEPIDVYAVRDGLEEIVTLYREEGFSQVVVTINEDVLDRTGELVYIVSEGLRTQIRKILFEGNESIPDFELKRHIATKAKLWIFNSGVFDKDIADTDIAMLQNFYRDKGFLDARARYRVEESNGGQDLTVIYTVDEGRQYKVEHIQFNGATVFSSQELTEWLSTRAGETVKRPEVANDARLIQKKYGELGYIYAQVRIVRVFSNTPGFVRITFEIAEGEQFKVGNVIVRGNTRTKDKVVRRALNLFPPDDLLNMTEAVEARQKLLDTKIFTSVRVFPIGDQPGVRDIIIDVEESEKAGDFVFGMGVTSNSGLIGSIVLDLQNFDLFDTPRNLSELFKLRSFFGAGQHFRLEILPGTQVNRFRMDFTEPYFLDKPIRFDASGFSFERGRDGYNERRGGATFSFGRRIERGFWQGWANELSLRVEIVNVNVQADLSDVFASKEIRRDEGSNLMTSVKFSLARDRRNNRFLPTSGDRFNLGFEQFAGDHMFGKLTAGYTTYRMIRTDALDRKSVLKLRAEGGVVFGDAPVFERFFAGGTGSIRGFDFRGVGEHDGIDENNIGGDVLVLLGAEYSYPLYGDNVRGHFFIDSGTAGSGTYRIAIGAGLRLMINILGPIPLEFNLAFPVSSAEDDNEQVFSFLIGRLF